jgi:hypothetical protein
MWSLKSGNSDIKDKLLTDEHEMTAYKEYRSRLQQDAEYIEALRGKVRRIVSEKSLFPAMNDTKWLELQSAVCGLPFPPPYNLKCVTDDDEPGDFSTDAPHYLGDWSSYWDEGLPPFFNIERVDVLPRYGKHRGRLVADEILDETAEFIAILERIGIPYEEKNGIVVIYGYRKGC